LPPVSTTPVVQLELQNGPNGKLRGLGETDS
jgi:hypothetical protein